MADVKLLPQRLAENLCVEFHLYFSDIDECNITYHNNCDQLCVNIPGSFVCNCTTGYYLAQDGGSCIG